MPFPPPIRVVVTAVLFLSPVVLSSRLPAADPGTGKELLRLGGRGAEVFAVAYSRDGSRLATGGQDRTVTVWDATRTTAWGDKTADSSRDIPGGN